MQKCTLALGCFWKPEENFRNKPGIIKTEVGYAGGNKTNVTYKEVCSGETGHAEVVRLTFDDQLISFSEILNLFFKLHDPTTMNRQGPDVGTQYRSAAYFSNNEEKKIIENKIDALNESGKFSSKVVTEIEAISEFYDAEDYHQDYYKKRGIDGCAI